MLILSGGCREIMYMIMPYLFHMRTPEGVYQLQISIIDNQSMIPKANLAIEGKADGGWYPVGKIEIR